MQKDPRRDAGSAWSCQEIALWTEEHLLISASVLLRWQFSTESFVFNKSTLSNGEFCQRNCPNIQLWLWRLLSRGSSGMLSWRFLSKNSENKTKCFHACGWLWGRGKNLLDFSSSLGFIISCSSFSLHVPELNKYCVVFVPLSFPLGTNYTRAETFLLFNLGSEIFLWLYCLPFNSSICSANMETNFVISASEVYHISSSAQEAHHKLTAYSLHWKSKKLIWVLWEER